MSGEGYAQAGAATFDTAVNWLLYGEEREKIGKWRDEDLAIAKEARRTDLAQRAFENLLTERGFDFNEAQFSFGKEKWGDEFGLTRQQARLNMDIAKKQEGRAQESFDIQKRQSSLANLANTLNRNLVGDVEMKKLLATRMGA